MDSFNEWFNKFHHTKPTPPPTPHVASFTEKVAHEHRLKQYEQELDRWQRGLLSQTEVSLHCQSTLSVLGYIEISPDPAVTKYLCTGNSDYFLIQSTVGIPRKYVVTFKQCTSKQFLA